MLLTQHQCILRPSVEFLSLLLVALCHQCQAPCAQQAQELAFLHPLLINQMHALTVGRAGIRRRQQNNARSVHHHRAGGFGSHSLSKYRAGDVRLKADFTATVVKREQHPTASTPTVSSHCAHAIDMDAQAAGHVPLGHWVTCSPPSQQTLLPVKISASSPNRKPFLNLFLKRRLFPRFSASVVYFHFKIPMGNLSLPPDSPAFAITRCRKERKMGNS